MAKIEFGNKLNKWKQNRQKSTFKELRTRKLIGFAARYIHRKDSLYLDNADIEEICIKVYGSYNKTMHQRVRRYLSSEQVQKEVYSELQHIYASNGMNKETIGELVREARLWIIEKKDVTNALKLIEKLEKLYNLEQKAEVNATETRTFSSFSDLKDNKPSKIVQTIATNAQINAIQPPSDTNTEQPDTNIDPSDTIGEGSV